MTIRKHCCSTILAIGCLLWGLSRAAAGESAVTVDLSTGVLSAVRPGGDQSLTLEQRLQFPTTGDDVKMESENGEGFYLEYTGEWVLRTDFLAADNMQVANGEVASLTSGYIRGVDLLQLSPVGGTWYTGSGGTFLYGPVAAGMISYSSDTNKPYYYDGSNWQPLGGSAGSGSGGVSAVNTRTGSVTLTKADVGLGNVANADTTDASNISSGTLNPARLPASVPLLDDNGVLTLTPLIPNDNLQTMFSVVSAETGSGFTIMGDGSLFSNGEVFLDGAGNLYAGVYGNQSVYAGGLYSPSGAIIDDDGEGGWGFQGGAYLNAGGNLSISSLSFPGGFTLFDDGNYGVAANTDNSSFFINQNAGFGNGFSHDDGSGNFTAVAFYGDARNLFNVPSPVGLSVDSANYISTGGATNSGSAGSMDVGDGSGQFTPLLSGPGTLGPLDGSELMFNPFNEATGPIVNNPSIFFDTYGSANFANYANRSFDDFFGYNGYNTDISFPGDGTFSLMNGNFTGNGENIYLLGSIEAFGGVGSESGYSFGGNFPSQIYVSSDGTQLIWQDNSGTEHVLATGSTGG